jgi:hypothetical protein
MKTNRIIIFSILLIVLAIGFIVPSQVNAEAICCASGTTCTPGTTCADGSPCGGLCNPLGASDMSLIDLWVRILQLMLGGVGLFAVMMFIYGGFTMLTSGGNPEKVKKAKDTLAWAVLGLATIILSGAAVRYLFENFNFS